MMFANRAPRDPLGIEKRAPYMTPPIAPPASFDIPEREQPKRGGMFGGKGGRALGIGLDILLGAFGASGVYGPAMQQRREQEREDERLQLAQEREDRMMNKPQVVQLGNGGIALVGPDGVPKIIRPPEQNKPPAVLIAEAAGLTPGTQEWQRALTAAIPGYGNTEQVIDYRAEAASALAAQRAAASAALKAQPTYSAAHPKPKASGGQYEYRMGPNGKLQKRRVG